MPLVSGAAILRPAQQAGSAIGAFNFNNLEQLQAIVRAAEAEQTPVFISTTEGAISYAGLASLVALARVAATEVTVPLALHLDHGKDLDLISACIRAGYTSVMIDASHLPLAENIRQTQAVVKMAHRHGVAVEAELGRLQGIEDTVSVAEQDAVLVNPEEAERFVRETGVDSLAPAIGTAHGAFKFKGEPKLDFARLQAVKQRTGIPLVLHGASSVPQETIAQATRYGAKLAYAQGVPLSDVQQAIRLGINKVNVDTDLRLALLTSIRKTLNEHPEEFDPRRILGPARDAMTEIVRARIRAFRLIGEQ